MSVTYKLLTNYVSKRFGSVQASTIKGKAQLTLQQHVEWNRNGFIIVRGTFISIYAEIVE